MRIKILNLKSLHCKSLLLAKRASSCRRASSVQARTWHGGHCCGFTLTSPPMLGRCRDQAGHERTKINAEVDFHRCTLPEGRKRLQSDRDAACFLQFECNVSFEFTRVSIHPSHRKCKMYTFKRSHLKQLDRLCVMYNVFYLKAELHIY